MKQQIPPHQQHQEDRQRFQVERMILFTDAVFAIAITLLILEIKVPVLEYQGLSSAKIQDVLLAAFPTWIGFFISFWVIALFWIDHHKTFAYVDDYSKKLVFLNLLFLLTIVIMPFTSALYSKYFYFALPTQIYCLNVALTGYVKLWMSYYIYNPKNKISHFPIENIRKKYYLTRSWITPIVFTIMGLMAADIGWSKLLFLAIFVAQIVVGRYYEKNHGLKDRFK